MLNDQNESAPKIKPIEHQIVYLINGQPVNVDLNEINKLFNDVKVYNNNFNVFSMMGRYLGGSASKPDEVAPMQTKISEEENNAQITAFFIESKNKTFLNNLGLTMEPVKGISGVVSNDGSGDSVEMQINLIDVNRLATFLEAINPGQIDTQDIKDGFKKLTDVISGQIYRGYNLPFPDPETVALLNNSDKIINEYKRLGMEEFVANLELYYKHENTGNLSEFINIQNKNLLQKPGEGFGPGNWQADISPEEFLKRWDDAITILQSTKEDLRDPDLYKDLKTNLRQSVDFALDETPKIAYISDKVKSVFINILGEIKQKLGDFD